MSDRFTQLQNWLAACPTLQNIDYTPPVPASSDASFRRYYRIEVALDAVKRHPNLLASYIIMDAPPEHEDCRPFIQVSRQLGEMGVLVPNVIEQDLKQGFLLLSDLGNTTYLSVLSEDNAEQLYGDAFDSLVLFQQKGKALADGLPAYDERLLHNEMDLFSDWLLNRHLQKEISPKNNQVWLQTKQMLAKNALKQPQTYVHRDYHSRNLMYQSGANNPGVLDFQDAVKGPLTYDVISLIRDCYIVWPPEQVKEWQRQYFLKLCEANMLVEHEWHDFVKSMDWMGVQRHLKAAGIFARLFHRDGKDGYLNDIPNTVQYIHQIATEYPDLHALADWVEADFLSVLDGKGSV